ncbi:MAG TPA: hypothetical protein VIL36_19735 [Acidimicrobiales bacterium]
MASQILTGELEPLPMTCPRCGHEVSERFYGPCSVCRTALRAAHSGEARDVEVAAYEPKMNVTPNAVALKDD